MNRALRVLVVDDSALVRRTVRRLLEEDPAISVVGTASDGEEAIREVGRLHPDVVTLDVSMPVMDGLTCLAELVRRYRQRVVLLSTLAVERSFTTYKALALGAIDFVAKPGAADGATFHEELGRELRAKVWTAASVPAERIGRLVSPEREPRGPRTADGRGPSFPDPLPPRGIVGVGGSTGGSLALEVLLRSLPAAIPAAILAVQHVPQGFSAGLARYLDGVSGIPVKEAEGGEPIFRGRMYLAPGGAHLRVQRTASGPVLRLDAASPADSGYRPSVDALLCSTATAARENAIGVLLSGMGDDGVAGMAAVRKLGGKTFAQDESSSVVYGMAAKAVSSGAVGAVVPLDRLGDAVARAVRSA